MADFISEDTLPYIRVICLDQATKLPLDLTGGTMQLRFKIGNMGVIERTMTIEGLPSAGVVRYQFAAGELTDGPMEYEVTIISGGLELTSQEKGFYQVRARIS